MMRPRTRPSINVLFSLLLDHPTCLDLSLNIVSRIRSYEWQCPDCKICAQCKENADEDKMLFCDTCDRG